MLVKRNAKLCLLLIVIMASTLWFPPAAPGQEKKEAELKKKIADITQFKGEVLVRTRMAWQAVDKTPYPLFSEDKVATKQGRAEIVFADGGIMRLGLDSEVKISERKEEVGVIRKRIVVKRDVKVLLGEMTADMKKGPDQEITFKTPTMVAGIKGTETYYEVSATGETRFGASGETDTTGNFTRSDRVPSEPSDRRDPARADHALLREATQAAIQHQAARQEDIRAQAQRQNADQAANAAKTNPTSENLKNAANARANAADTGARAADGRADANVSTIQEMRSEANQMRDAAAAREADRTLNEARAIAARTETLLNTVRGLADAARAATDPREAVANSLAATTNANSAQTNANLSSGQANVANAQVNNDAEGVRSAQQFTQTLQTLVQSATALAQNTQNALRQIEAATTDAAKSTGLAVLQSAENAAKAAVDATIANVVATNMAATGDAEGLAKATEAVKSTTNIAEQAASHAQNGQQLLRAVGEAKTEAAARVVADAAQTIANSTQALSNTTANLASFTTATSVGDERGAKATEEAARSAQSVAQNANTAANRALDVGVSAATATGREVGELSREVKDLSRQTNAAVTETMNLATQAFAQTQLSQTITGQTTSVIEAAPITVVEGPPPADQTTQQIQQQQQQQTQTQTSTTGTQEEVRAKTPDITAVSEADIKGRIEDTIQLQLTGTNFTGSTVALPPGFEVLGFTISSDTQILISARLKPEIAGVTTGDVRVTSLGGTGTFSITIPSFPLITSITENRLPLGEIMSVSLEGKNFQQGMSLNFGQGVTVQSITVVDSQHVSVQLNVNVGATLGLRDVTITHPNGNSSLLSGGTTVVLPPPPPPPTPSK